jgi:hypothetical protein
MSIQLSEAAAERIGGYLRDKPGSVALRFGSKPADLAGMLEYLSTKIGIVLLILGLLHFFNICTISGMRRRAIAEKGRQL